MENVLLITCILEIDVEKHQYFLNDVLLIWMLKFNGEIDVEY